MAPPSGSATCVRPAEAPDQDVGRRSLGGMRNELMPRAIPMTYLVLRYVHLLGLTLMGAGLIAVWYADLRSRQVSDLVVFAEAVRQIAVFYDGLVVPGALLLLGSGTWLTVTVYAARHSSACRGSPGWWPSSPSRSSSASASCHTRTATAGGLPRARVGLDAAIESVLFFVRRYPCLLTRPLGVSMRHASRSTFLEQRTPCRLDGS
jgi:hypothetical protein